MKGGHSGGKMLLAQCQKAAATGVKSLIATKGFASGIPTQANKPNIVMLNQQSQYVMNKGNGFIDQRLLDSIASSKPVGAEMMRPLNLQDQHLQNFWGKWLRKDQQPSEGAEQTNQEGEQSMAQRKGQLETEEEWVDSDMEQHDDEAWGMKPRDKQPTQQAADEDMFDSDWDDSDDDESGGHMMPVADW